MRIVIVQLPSCLIVGLAFVVGTRQSKCQFYQWEHTTDTKICSWLLTARGGYVVAADMQCMDVLEKGLRTGYRYRAPIQGGSANLQLR